MTLIEQLHKLNDTDEFNIPLTTLSYFCDTSVTTLSEYMKGRRTISAELEQKIRDGIQEYIKQLEGIL